MMHTFFRHCLTRVLPLLIVAWLTTGCFSSRHSAKLASSSSASTVAAGYDAFASGNEATIRFGQLKKREWCYPLPGAKLISPFGGKRPNHKGSDLKTRAGDEVRAAFGGKVTFSGQMRGYGNVVFISHPNGLETRYSHNQKNLAKKGDTVKAGEVIALEGQTGNATTPHVHFETRIGGQAFDSAFIFDHEEHQLRSVRLTARKHKNGTVEVKAK